MARVSVNIMVLVGASIAVSAALLPWCTSIYGHSATPLDTELLTTEFPSGWLSFFSIVILCGAIIGFISPLASILEVSGVLVFLYYFSPTIPIPPGAPHYESGLIPGYAPILAVWAAVLMLVGVIWPLGLGFGRQIDSRDRLLTFHFNMNRDDTGQRATRLAILTDIVDAGGVTLVFGGAAMSIYSTKEADMMDPNLISNSQGVFGVLNLLGDLGILVSIVGAAILVLSILRTLRPTRGDGARKTDQ